MVKHFLIFSLYFFWVFCTFVNDYTFMGVSVFLILWPFFMVGRYLVGDKLKSIEFFSQILILILISPSFINEFFYGDSFYALNYLFIVLYVNYIAFLSFLLNRYPKFVFKMTVFFIFLFFVVSLYLVLYHQGQLRASIGFGPNVLYRIYGVLFVVALISSSKYMGMKLWPVYFVYLLVLLPLLATGSRGATLIIAYISLVLLFYVILVNGVKSLYRILFFLFGGLFLLVFQYADELGSVFNRLIYFDFNGRSITHRFEAFYIFSEFLKSPNGLDNFFGETSVNKYFTSYPHNMVLESIMYSGWLFSFIFFVLFIFTLIFLCFDKRRVIISIYVPIFIGSMVSGNLYYNFVLFSVASYFGIIFLLRFFRGCKKNFDNFPFRE